LLLLSALLYSFAGVNVKLAANTGLSSSELVLLRAIFQGTLVMAGMMYCRTDEGVRLLWQPFGSTREIQKIVFVRGIIGATGFCLYFYTIAALPLGDATALVALKPVPTIFLGRILLGEQIKLLHILVTVASVAGSILIAQPSFFFGKEQAQASLGHVTGLLGACCAAGVVTLIRKAGTIGAHTLQLLFSWAFFGILFSAIALGRQHWRLPPTLESWLYVLAMSAIGSAAHFLLNYAGRLAPASLSSIMRSSDLMFAYIWEIFIFHQVPNLWTWTGVGFISLSLIMIAIQKVRDHHREATIQRHLSDMKEDEDPNMMTAEDDTFLDEHDLEMQQVGNKIAGYTKVAASEDSSS
jgi:drug/metabolite transporter (DMT)-like permease